MIDDSGMSVLGVNFRSISFFEYKEMISECCLLRNVCKRRFSNISCGGTSPDEIVFERFNLSTDKLSFELERTLPR